MCSIACIDLCFRGLIACDGSFDLRVKHIPLLIIVIHGHFNNLQ